MSITTIKNMTISGLIFYLCLFLSVFQAVFVIKSGGVQTISMLDLLSTLLIIVSLLSNLNRKLIYCYVFIILFFSLFSLIHIILGNDVNLIAFLLFLVRISACFSLLHLSCYYYKNVAYSRFLLDSLVYITIFTAIFSFYESFLVLKFGFPRLVPSFLDGANQPISRLRGLFSEPSLYAVFLLPIFIYTLAMKRRWQSVVIGFTLILTASSFIVLSLIILLLIFTKGIASTLKVMLTLAMGLLLFGWFFGADELLYSLYNKVINYLQFYQSGSSSSISDSGGIRAYTTFIGLKIFLLNPFIGVGVGNSPIYVSEHLDIALVNSGLVNMNIPIQSAIPHALAELGLFSLTILSVFYYYLKSVYASLSLRFSLVLSIYIGYIYILMYPLNNPLLLVFVSIMCFVLYVVESSHTDRVATDYK